MSYNENGEGIRRFITRRTPTVMAGSRLPYLDPVIPFSYESLVDAIGRAIDKQQEMEGVKVVDTAIIQTVDKLDYNAIREEARNLWEQLVGTGAEMNEDMARRIQKRIEMIFVRVVKLSEITEDQVDLFNLVLIDMRELANSN